MPMRGKKCRNEDKMNQDFLEVSIGEKDRTDICGRYHFGDTGPVLLQEVYEEFLAGIGAAVYYEILEGAENGKKEAWVIVTLGSRPDEAQEKLMAAGRLSEAYMVECLSMELLTAACGKADRLLHEKSGLWCGAYLFPGVQSPIEELRQLFTVLKPEEVRYNSAYALVPQKSVAYRVPLLSGRPERGRREETCAGCNRKDCSARCLQAWESGAAAKNLNYGYRRIFDGRK